MPRRSLAAVVLVALLAVSGSAFASVSADDPRRSQMWWFDRMGVEQAWGSDRGAGITVAVLDTGIDATHPDLQGQLGQGIDLVDNDDDPSDPHGHGTIVGGLVSAVANNGEGIAGVAPDSTLVAVRVLDDQGRGESGTVDAGIRWAVDNGADIVNLSLEVEEVEGGPDPRLIAPNAAIEYAWERGVIVVAATGNSAAGASGYDDDSHVVLVGAVDRNDSISEFSDTGRMDALVAPGQEIISTWCQPTPTGCNPDARYGQGNGTSFAAPLVVGVLALLRGAGLDHTEAVATLRATAVDLGDAGADPTYGVGRVDAAAALAAAPAVLEGGVAALQAPPEPEPTAEATAAETDGTTTSPAPTQSETEPSPTPSVPVQDTDGEVTLAPEDPEPGDALAAPDTEPSTDPDTLALVASIMLAVAMVLLSRESRLVRQGTERSPVRSRTPR